ncbi:MAG: DUF547 domain-containing protein [Rhodospirillales bacterium]|nr:DUF547 domain-containing protein [Rhodospirillales bacterium]
MFLESTLAPKAELWPRWQAYSAISRDRIDHRDWDAFLKSYVKPGKDGVNRIPYGRVTETSKKALHAYLDRLRQTPIKLFNRREQKAYWINLYNALTVRLVLEYFPVASIKDIEVSSSPFGGPWDRKLLEIDGEPVSLNDIEHRILRPIWRDPRIHYAVNCASIGCPNLLPVAFTGDNEDTLLELAANAYVNHRRGARIEDGNLIVSKIYGWYAEDFGDSDQGVIAHLRSYGEEPLIKALKGRGTIDDYEYDWKLNGAP